MRINKETFELGACLEPRGFKGARGDGCEFCYAFHVSLPSSVVVHLYPLR